METKPILDKLTEQLRRVLVPYFGESDPSAYAAQYGDRFTTFDPWSGGRKDDHEAAAYTMSFAGSLPSLEYELLNERVDILGDAAIFTLNVDLIDPESGDRVAQWNTTQIHDLSSEDLDLVHTHWSYSVPPDTAPEGQ